MYLTITPIVPIDGEFYSTYYFLCSATVLCGDRQALSKYLYLCCSEVRVMVVVACGWCGFLEVMRRERKEERNEKGKRST